MKILLVTGIYPPEVGGPATYAKLLATELPKRGIDVRVLPFSEVRKYPRIIRHLIYFLKIIKQAYGSDVIFSQDPISAGLPALCAGKLLGKKIVLRIAGDYVWEQSVQRYGVKETIDNFQNKKYGFYIELLRWLQSFTVRNADVVISPSKYFANLVSGWNNHSRRVVPIYNGIDLKMEFKKENKYDTPTIITAGRLVQWKGIDHLIESLTKLSGWRLLIAGEGPDRLRLEDIAKKNRVLNRVEFLGQLSREKLFERIYCSHIFALLSTFESFSFQIVEAMNVGTPVVTLDIGNLNEIITNQKDGILLPQNKISEFSLVVKTINLDKEFYLRLAEGGKLRAKDFSIEKTIDQVAGTLRALNR